MKSFSINGDNDNKTTLMHVETNTHKLISATTHLPNIHEEVPQAGHIITLLFIPQKDLYTENIK